MTALAASSGGCRTTAAISIDRAIRLSTAAAVLAVAGIARMSPAGTPTRSCGRTARAGSPPGWSRPPSTAWCTPPAWSSCTRPGTGYQSRPGPLAARAGHRGHPHGEHSSGLVTRSRRCGGRGRPAVSLVGSYERDPGVAHPHRRGAGTRTAGGALLREYGVPRCGAFRPSRSRSQRPGQPEGPRSVRPGLAAKGPACWAAGRPCRHGSW